MDNRLPASVTLPRAVLLSILMLAACKAQGKNALAENRPDNAALALSTAEPFEAGNSALAMQDTAPSNHGYTIDTSNKPLVGVLREIFVRAGTIDGKPIKDFALKARCQTAFVTDGETVTIDWSKVGNYAGSLSGGHETFPIDDGHGTHSISVPAGHHPEPLGDSGARTDSGFGSLADSCQQ